MAAEFNSMVVLCLIGTLCIMAVILAMTAAIKVLRVDKTNSHPNPNAVELIPPANGCTDKFCVHGECVGHEPEWDVLETELKPMSFWRRYKYTFILPPIAALWIIYDFLAVRCCGAAMRPVYNMNLGRCKKCGKARNFEPENSAYHNEFAMCACCGKQVPLRLPPDSGD